MAVGGFDPRLYARPAIEDIELGYRLSLSGHKVVLARDVQGTHLKRWTLRSVVMTDIFQRGVPWMLLMKRLRVAETDLNVRPEQKVCVAASGLAAVAACGALAWPWLLAAVAAYPVAVVGLNRAFYAFLVKRRGLAFAAASVPLHFVYYVCCGVSVVIALTYWHLSKHGRAAAVAAPAPGPAAGRFARRDGAAGGAATGPITSRPGRPTTWTGR